MVIVKVRNSDPTSVRCWTHNLEDCDAIQLHHRTF